MNTTSPALIERLRKLEPYLAGSILGQAHVISRVVSVLHRGELGLSTLGRPRGSFLLLGPTGVGKTELTIEFTRYLFGNDRLFRFDMSEFQTQDTIGLLLGARINDVGLLARPLAGGNEGTLLFDEIEKAHPRVLDLLLQILDAARVTIASGETLDFSTFYVVLTSNLGAFEILSLQHSSFATMERHVLAKAQQSLRPELFARITEKLVFNRLSYDVQLEIARQMLTKEINFLITKEIEISCDRSVLPFLVRRGFHPRLGARPMRDAIEYYVRGAVAEAELVDISSARGEIAVSGDALVFRVSTNPNAPL